MINYRELPEGAYKTAYEEFMMQGVTSPSRLAIPERMLIAGVTAEDAANELVSYAGCDVSIAMAIVKAANSRPVLKKEES